MPRAQSRPHQAVSTSGATIKALGNGFEYVKSPSSAAAASCGPAPLSRFVGATLRYVQRKYAPVTSATFSISGIQKTRYTGKAVAPKKAVVNSAAPAADEPAARNT